VEQSCVVFNKIGSDKEKNSISKTTMFSLIVTSNVISIQLF